MGIRGVSMVAAIGLGSLALACGSDNGGRDGSATVATSLTGLTSVSGGSDDGEDSGDEAAEGDDDAEGGSTFDLGNGVVDDGLDDGEECAEVIEEADVGLEGADIIIVIDNSVSMGNEIAQVQANMNALSMQIGAAVDPHIVMISGFQANSDSGICVNPPLGSGMCPSADHNPPTYWRVGNWVGSHSALQRVTSHYPDYASTIRDNASTHIVVITDDDSDNTAAAFDAEFKALNPKFADYRLHSIVANNGNVYKQLSMMTGGLIADINGSFQAVFDEIASDVIETATLSCEYMIPEPDGGQVFDQDEVNVEFQDGMGGTLSIGYVESAAECPNVTDGWYYDNVAAPQKIILCPQSCDGIQGFTLAKISLIFGCMTIPAG